MVTAVKISTNGEVEKTEMEPSLENLQKSVGGYIQVLYIEVNGEPANLYINEEGKLENLPVNQVASELCKGFISPNDCIVGDAILLGGGDSDGNDTSVTSGIVKWFLDNFS